MQSILCLIKIIILDIVKQIQKSCCEWKNRMNDDVCGLDNSRLELSDKMKHIYEKTSLATQFQSIGLEVVL